MSDPPNRAEETRAIEAVLQAEREAERAVADAKLRADQLRSDARQRARQVAERADARIRKLHARSAALADHDVERLKEEAEERERESRRSLSDDLRLATAVARVADWLLAESEES